MKYLAYGLLAFIVAVEACHNPLDGLTLGLKDPIQEGVVECRFYDPAGNPLPQVNQVKMAGPNADQVVTTVNTTHYKINSDGVMLAAASPLVTPSSQKPFRFSVVAEAPDYLTIIQPFVLTNVNHQTRSIRWINMVKPPRTLAAARSLGQASSDGVVGSPVNATTTQVTSDADKATVTVPAGTKLTDRDGQSVGGDLTLAVIHTNARNDAASSYIPGGGVMSNVAGRNGGPSLGTLRILSIAGSVTMQVYNEKYALATNVSQPIPWTMDLNPGTTNLNKSRAIQEGDSIPLFSYDESTNRWQEEKPGVVRYNTQTSRFEYRATARFVGAYVAGWIESICDAGPTFKVSSKLANVDVNYLCKLIDADNGQQVASFYANVNNGASITLYSQPKNRRLKLQVYDENDAWGKGPKGGFIAESGVGVTCSLTPVPIDLSGLPAPPIVRVAFDFTCSGGAILDESLLPALLKVQYSDVGKENWHDLIIVTRTQRQADSYKLQVGRTYDIRASSDGGASWPLRQPNYLIDSPTLTIKISADPYCR